MPCVNNRYTPDELESIFIWDVLCEAIPLSSEERAEIRRRDSENGVHKKPKSAEQREKALEYQRRWRAEHKEQIRAYNAAHRAEINERQKNYDKAKRSKAGVP